MYKIMKTCKECKNAKSNNDFSKGQGKCKQCRNNHAKKQYDLVVKAKESIRS